MGALHGELVEVEVSLDERGRSAGTVVAVPEQLPKIAGKIQQGPDGSMVLVPTDFRFPAVPLAGENLPVPGTLIVAQLVGRSPQGAPYSAVVDQVIGLEPTAATIARFAALNHSITYEFGKEVMQEAAALGSEVRAEDLGDRRDLRNVPFVTIDGKKSRDLDDAVWAEPRGTGWLLRVAIADVSHYVRPGTALDRSAQQRATSVYLPGTVWPMLPSSISQGLCSLNPGVDRLCQVCEMHIGPDGIVTDSSIYPAIMNSHARLTYEGVDQFLFRGASAPSSWNPDVKAPLAALKSVFEVLHAKRLERGAMEFGSTEVVFSFDAEGLVKDLHSPARTQAHRLIEECMVAANVEAAKHLDSALGVFRTHESPTTQRLDRLAPLLEGEVLPSSENIRPSDLGALLAKFPHLSSSILRTQGKASYTAMNMGHFGLGLTHYTHFTSPIRRYPDLLVHRALKGELSSELEPMLARCNEAERAATSAEREAIDRLRCAWLQGKIGTACEAKIDSVTARGVWVVLKENGASSFLPASSFGPQVALCPISQKISLPDLELRAGQSVPVEITSACWHTMRVELRTALPAPAEEVARVRAPAP